MQRYFSDCIYTRDLVKCVEGSNEVYLVPEVDAALVEKEGQISALKAANEMFMADKAEQREQIASLEAALAEKEQIIQESCQVLARGIKVVEYLQEQLANQFI